MVWAVVNVHLYTSVVVKHQLDRGFSKEKNLKSQDLCLAFVDC